MAFSRKFLIDNGVPEDKVDIIMGERQRTLADYVPKADVQAQIDEALSKHKADPIDPKTTPEYMALVAENSKLKAFQTEEFSVVKDPYRDIVWDKLNHEKDHKPYAEQLTEIKTAMPDLFVVQEQQEPAGNNPPARNTPQYSQQPGSSNSNPQSEEDKLVDQLKGEWKN